MYAEFDMVEFFFKVKECYDVTFGNIRRHKKIYLKTFGDICRRLNEVEDLRLLKTYEDVKRRVETFEDI